MVSLPRHRGITYVQESAAYGHSTWMDLVQAEADFAQMASDGYNSIGFWVNPGDIIEVWDYTNTSPADGAPGFSCGTSSLNTTGIHTLSSLVSMAASAGLSSIINVKGPKNRMPYGPVSADDDLGPGSPGHLARVTGTDRSPPFPWIGDWHDKWDEGGIYMSKAKGHFYDYAAAFNGKYLAGGHQRKLTNYWTDNNSTASNVDSGSYDAFTIGPNQDLIQGGPGVGHEALTERNWDGLYNDDFILFYKAFLIELGKIFQDAALDINILYYKLSQETLIPDNPWAYYGSSIAYKFTKWLQEDPEGLMGAKTHEDLGASSINPTGKNDPKVIDNWYYRWQILGKDGAAGLRNGGGLYNKYPESVLGGDAIYGTSGEWQSNTLGAVIDWADDPTGALLGASGLKDVSSWEDFSSVSFKAHASGDEQAYSFRGVPKFDGIQKASWRPFWDLMNKLEWSMASGHNTTFFDANAGDENLDVWNIPHTANGNWPGFTSRYHQRADFYRFITATLGGYGDGDVYQCSVSSMVSSIKLGDPGAVVAVKHLKPRFYQDYWGLDEKDKVLGVSVETPRYERADWLSKAYGDVICLGWYPTSSVDGNYYCDDGGTYITFAEHLQDILNLSGEPTWHQHSDGNRPLTIWECGMISSGTFAPEKNQFGGGGQAGSHNTAREMLEQLSTFCDASDVAGMNLWESIERYPKTKQLLYYWQHINNGNGMWSSQSGPRDNEYFGLKYKGTKYPKDQYNIFNASGFVEASSNTGGTDFVAGDRLYVSAGQTVKFINQGDTVFSVSALDTSGNNVFKAWNTTTEAYDTSGRNILPIAGDITSPFDPSSVFTYTFPTDSVFTVSAT